MLTSHIFSSIKASFVTSLLSSNIDKANQQEQSPSTPLQTSKQSNVDTTEMTALNMIELEPKKADGYLLAGQLYEKQGRLSAARAMYADSLTHVPSTNPQYDELCLALKKLDMRFGSFIFIFPYDILCIIFSHLALNDLIQITGVCQSWSDFMLQWHEFWYLLDGVIDRAIVDSLLNGKDDRFHMHGEGKDILCSFMLKFLVASNARNVKDIKFEDMLLKREHIGLVVRAAKSCNSTVERITFKDVPLGNPARVLLDIIGQCPQLKHFSYHVGKRNGDPRTTFVLPIHVEDPPLSAIPYDIYMLSTLDLSMGPFHRGFGPQQQRPIKLLQNLIKRCPHLERLCLNVVDNIEHGKVMRAAVKHCPLMKDLVWIYLGSEVPNSAKYTHDKLPDSEKKGLERLVISYIPACFAMSTSDVAQVIKKHHKSLSTLYLHFDKKVVDTGFLFLLAHCGMPQLRKLYLFIERDSVKQYSGRRRSPFSRAITALATSCPQLQVFHIVVRKPLLYDYGRCNVSVDNQAVLTVLQHCPFIRQLKIDTRDQNIIRDNLTTTAIEALKNTLVDVPA